MDHRLAHGAIAVLLLSLSLTASAGWWSAREPLTFAAMGDGPRQDVEWPIFEEQIADENSEGRSAFILHVGDIWHGCETLPESHYERVADALRDSTIPVVIVPGDNEWNDLEEAWRAPNLTRIQIDQVAKNRPLLVTVTGDRDNPFVFDRRLKTDK